VNGLLCLVFFVSGASALLFETLWFRQAGLSLGNSIWTTSLVTASFMGGLALGNALAARHTERLARPVRTYAVLEALIGGAGLGLVLLFPVLTPILAPAFTSLLPWPEAVAALRVVCAFTLLLVPATAMGATLPLLARALSARDQSFGRVLGLLYGWNTLGAFVGALAGEGFLIARLGVIGTGVFAASLNGLAALFALALSRADAVVPLKAQELRTPFGPQGWRVLGAACVSGAILLALEVVWFRLLLMFVFGTSLAFAVLLAVVLLGIGLGGLAAGIWLRREQAAGEWLPALALAAGGVTAWNYASLPDVLATLGGRFLLTPADVARVALPLMLPTAFLSGVLFTAMGIRLRELGHAESRAAGALTLANTSGAMVGALLGGFLMLPGFGVERPLFALSAAYLVTAGLTYSPGERGKRPGRLVALGLAAAFFAAVHALFPFGLMKNYYMPLSTRRWQEDGSRVVARREGLTETITYLRKDLWDDPVYYRLVTNGFSMSGSMFRSLRYMELYVYWPIAVHPAPKRALLISYGVGITAKALTDTKELESIDVVDVSRDILEAGRTVFPQPGAFPLDDPRVRVHVEDGRFFLLTAPGAYDLITAEPPPPKNAGIVNLYSREYFALVRQRLAPGGIATYWLPVHQLSVAESNAIIRGFCDAFEDCSLWTGSGLEWMLVGTREARGPVSEERFTAQWNDPRVGAKLRAVGFESPELLGTTFLADADALREMVGGTEPLDDDHPLRVTGRFEGSDAAFARRLDTEAARRHFAESPLVRRLWPAGLRERTVAAFPQQEMLNRALGFGAPYPALADLDAALTTTSLRTPVLLGLKATEVEIAIAGRAAQRGVSEPLLDEFLGIGALADRDYPRAAERLCRANARASDPAGLAPLCIMALAYADRQAEAAAALAATRALPGADPAGLAWLQQRFGLPAR
jgi:spermidine synthase